MRAVSGIIMMASGALCLLLGLAYNAGKECHNEQSAVKNCTGPVYLNANRFVYDKHVYIVFNAGFNSQSIVHDPDCTCTLTRATNPAQ